MAEADWNRWDLVDI